MALPHTLASGPFAGLEVPFASASANAAHVHKSLIDTYLITHPHLDHISGFVINTAGLPGSRPKRLAGLPSTIAAFKTHIFNNVIWPNLSDENNGAGLVTYMRLVEGGSPAFGDGEGKGYLEVSEGLAVKIWGVSHGHCIERHSHRGSGSSTRFGSVDASVNLGPMAMGMGSSIASPRGLVHHAAASPNLSAYLHQQRDQLNSPQLPQQQQQQQQGVVPGSNAASGGGRTSSVSGGVLPSGESVCVYDSSAYFIRDMVTGREVLIFGDVEPDSISLSPRNLVLWQEAAPKIATGKLAAIFIECSYDDSQSVDRLFGHLAPRFIIEELVALAAEVGAARMMLRHQQGRDSTASQDTKSGTESEKKKRKREPDDSVGGSAHSRKTGEQTAKRVTSGLTEVTTASTQASQTDDPVSPKTVKPGRGPVPRAEDESPHVATPTGELSLGDVELPAPVTPLRVPALSAAIPEQRPLRGLKVVIIHMKDKLNDGPHIGDLILSELAEYEKEAQLGCEFMISSSGQSLYL